MISAYHMISKPDGGWLKLPFRNFDWEYQRQLSGTYSVATESHRAQHVHFKLPECNGKCWAGWVMVSQENSDWEEDLDDDCPLHGSVPYLNLLDLVYAEEGIDMKDGIELGGG